VIRDEIRGKREEKMPIRDVAERRLIALGTERYFFIDILYGIGLKCNLKIHFFILFNKIHSLIYFYIKETDVLYLVEGEANVSPPWQKSSRYVKGVGIVGEEISESGDFEK
jgi:hypothetical protein